MEEKQLDGCENAKEVASKYGFQIVCDEEEGPEEETSGQMDPSCENAKEVASKYGYQIVCDEDE